MNIFPISLKLTNIITLVCRLLSACDDQQYDPPVKRPDYRDFPVEKSAPVVWTNSGRVKGYHMMTVRGAPIFAFEGIPYALSPVGERRFSDPVPAKPWNGIFEATKPGPICIQLDYGRLIGSEKGCLTLNIYTKNVNPITPYPVILFTHGGFWISGAGSYVGPAYLLENDVILVTYNHRLGPLGFWTTGDDKALGNWGLKDQALVINYVYENIRNFGGDPTKISLMGNSAGSASTHFHMISNSEVVRNRIASAISMSGTAYNVWALNKLNTSIHISREIARASGCPVNFGSEKLVRCMRSVDANTLVSNQLLTLKRGLFFLPSIQPNLPGAYLTLEPDQAYAAGQVAKIPWIVTQTSREINLITNRRNAKVALIAVQNFFSSHLSRLLVLRGNVTRNEDIIRSKIIAQYSPTKDSSRRLEQEEFSKIATHRYFAVGIRKAIQMHSQVAPTYASIFNYSSELGRAGRQGFANFEDFGVFHGDDMAYIFNSTKSHPPIRRLDPHYAVTKLMVNLFGNFARFGEPLYIDETPHRIWDAVPSPDRVRFLVIDKHVRMIEDPFASISRFWESLGIPDMTPYFKL